MKNIRIPNFRTGVMAATILATSTSISPPAASLDAKNYVDGVRYGWLSFYDRDCRKLADKTFAALQAINASKDFDGDYIAGIANAKKAISDEIKADGKAEVCKATRDDFDQLLHGLP